VRYLELCTLGDRATRVARSLAAAGVTRGDRIGLFMTNGAEFVEILFGILSACASSSKPN
jgi:acyl-CoA synthetase (AMP-forming)/AMP-acid ligase II